MCKTPSARACTRTHTHKHVIPQAFSLFKDPGGPWWGILLKSVPSQSWYPISVHCFWYLLLTSVHFYVSDDGIARSLSQPPPPTITATTAAALHCYCYYYQNRPSEEPAPGDVPLLGGSSAGARSVSLGGGTHHNWYYRRGKGIAYHKVRHYPTGVSILQGFNSRSVASLLFLC